ncbi:MAG: hypothetical protein HXY40_02455 [Chloroflexi bacterium]|nr:hypothetical protein [Chloroflexota bacterium]
MSQRTFWLRRLDPRIWLILFGASCGILLAFVLRPLLPVRVSNHHVFTDYDGDTFRHQPGQVRPPAENRVLEDLYRQSDANGFRLPALTASFYPIVALGDSFTDGGQVPWVDVLARHLNIPVQNLGWSGFGPLEYVQVLRQFGAVPSGERRQWVLIGFFEGNDLGNIQTTYREMQENGGRIRLNLQHGTIAAVDPSERDYGITTRADDNYLYPLDHVINAVNYPLAYISDYIWWLNGTEDTYRQSQNFALLRQSLQDIQTLAGGACVGLVYIPDKSHIYFQYADPQGNRRWVLENALTLQRDAEGWLSFGALQPTAYEALMANIDNQRYAVQALAQELGIYFIDLVPALQAAALSGEPTYYAYDSHWSMRGHEVAGQAVAQFIAQAPDCQP